MVRRGHSRTSPITLLWPTPTTALEILSTEHRSVAALKYAQLGSFCGIYNQLPLKCPHLYVIYKDLTH